jgi:hypothetical protein
VIELFAAVVVLAVPPGFTEAKGLEPAASFVAKKPVAVYCARTTLAWQRLVAANAAPDGAIGLTLPAAGGDAIALVRAACDNLEQQLQLLGPAAAQLAPSLQALTHEAIHARGDADEGRTDCAAVHEAPGLATRFFKIRAGKQLRALMAAMWKSRATEPPVYRTVC